MARRRHSTKPCPDCTRTLIRVRRTAADREVVDPATGWPMGRYRCAKLGCGWQGLLPRQPRQPWHLPGSLQRPQRSPLRSVFRQVAALDLPWARAGSVLLVMLLLVLVGVQGARHMLGAQPMPVSEVLPAGQSHDGDALPSRHPWMRPVALAAADAAASMPSARPEKMQELKPPEPLEPLEMRRGCAWGQPGRNPYRGSVEQALLHARLPPEVVAEVGRKVRAREISDRLEIRTGSIVGVSHGRDFDPQHVAMSFGRTLCLNSRVNFAPGHVERADLYEARDARGRQHAVMVPDVCGNVSVLGERGERRRALMAAGGADEEWWVLATAAAMADENASVPEPGTLAAALAGLAALAALSRRRPAGVAADRRPGDGSEQR